MIHRLALLMGGAGAASVLALALVLGGLGSPLANTPDAFVQGANEGLDGGQVTQAAPTDEPASSADEPRGGSSQKVIDTVYVVPDPAGPSSAGARPASDDHQPGATPRPARDHNRGNDTGDQAGDDQGDDQSEASGDDQSSEGEHSDDGGRELGDD